MERAPHIVLTSAEGLFKLDAVYSVSAFQVFSWSSVPVQFRRADYLTFSTNFAGAVVSSDSTGEPCVNAGDILLLRKPSNVSNSRSP
jgi:hypothetical protein